VNRDGIIAANPLREYLRNRGFSLYASGSSLVSNACPVQQHRKFHRCNTIDTEKNLWHCNDCRVGGSIVDWLMHERNISAADALRELSGGRNGSEPLGTIVATYDYTDEAGKLLFQICRKDPKSTFPVRRPDGRWGVEGVRRVLYRLPEVSKAQLVCIAEGEKDCDNLAKLGFVATTNPFGAGKWQDKYSETLRDKDVVIFGDADEPGQAHVDSVNESLTGIARSIKRVQLPEGFHDVSDYIASLSVDTASQFIAELIDATPVLNSFTSSAGSSDEDDFPEPLDELAFHGLAGDIVRRIEPHTEADPVALLIQVLIAFGNVIGRAAHAMADGSRHAMNLFAVLVGKSSKARKGTSWAHVRRLFKRADEEWAQDCIANGLSSGEGVIWAVRDPITKTVKDKKSGGQKTEVIDEGIADKRLCVVEEEFANVLKAMSREGNTLSPVIRSAWDSGNLRSITKNAPARATDAHISILGHITRDELRRLLTETESANGFGNRFLWVAVRRSKCLPEGGNLDDDKLNDLVMQIHESIEFARTAGLATRDDDARKLWCEIYPQLSEGKPGLLGAITARAEAQVLRLSCIYALFDLKTKVGPEHLRAALALWDYSDRNARWIFGTATGNPDADRILQALRMAKAEGLTRTEISHGIFQRNINPAALDSALRLLIATGKAKPGKISTGGRMAERWVAV
jgi:5S rRNA maturation endonuclease (ribonuclease M5)